MAATLSPVPKLQFFDANGAPLAGGKLYSYFAGTTTPQSTYTDSTGTTSNPNPVILDARGEAGVWLANDAFYKLSLYTSTDVLVWTVDQIASNTTLATLAASGGSALVGYFPAGTGAVETTVQTALRRFSVQLESFGPVGNSTTGDDATFQAALNYLCTIPSLSGVQGELILPKAAVYLASPKVLGANIDIVGQGANFASAIVPLASFSGTALFKIDGSLCTGGFSYRQHHRGFTVNCTSVSKAILPKIFYINSAYTIRFSEIYCYNSFGTAFEITDSQDIVFDRPHVFGSSAGVAYSEYGIRCINSQVTLNAPDVEVWYKGISVEGTSKVTVNGHYMERNIIGIWQANTSTGFLTVVGGEVIGINAGTECFDVTGPNCTVIGGTYIANGGKGLNTNSMSTRQANVQFVGIAGDVSDPKNWATNILASNYTSASPTVGMYRTVDLPNVKLLAASAAASNIYKVTGAYNSFGFVDIDLMAQASYNPTCVYTAKYRIGFGAGSGSMIVTSVIEYGKTNINSGTTLAIVVTATATSATEITITVTPTLTGPTTTANIHCTATMGQSVSTGGTYLTIL